MLEALKCNNYQMKRKHSPNARHNNEKSDNYKGVQENKQPN